MNSIFFLIPLIALSIPLAFGEMEIGKNFDRELIQEFPDGTKQYLWTSHSDRMVNELGEYVDNFEGDVDFVWTETDDYLRFESVSVTFEFDRSSCDFEIYHIGKVFGEPVIESYNPTIAINGNPINLPVCNVNGIIQDNMGVDFTVNRGLVTVLYNLDYMKGVEWTYDIVGNGVITVTEVCTNCIGEIIDDQKIMFGDYILDTKNDIHGAFKESRQQGNDYHIVYEAESDGRLIIDPSLTASSTDNGVWDDSSATGTVCTAVTLNDSNDNRLFKARSGTAANANCGVGMVSFDVSSIDDNSTIDNVVIEYDVSGSNLLNVDWVYSDDLETDSATDRWANIITPTATLVSNDANPASAQTDFQQDLGATADSTLEAEIQDGDDTYSIGALYNDMVRDGLDHDSDFGNEELIITYTTHLSPDGVNDLTSTDITDTTVDLSWSEPGLDGETLLGYQINYTTPLGEPLTVITNNTGTGDTTTQVSGLTQLTDYTFRVSPWTNFGNNATGNLLNVTTLEDFTLANFTVGSFDVNATNPDIIQMFFERQDINDTALFLNVTYPNSYDLACDFSYQFANINQTYTNLSNVTISADAVESSFLFADVDNEVIDVYCWDQNNLDNDGIYIITQTSFQLLQQIQGFRSGDFGTSGDFGAIDLITLAVIIISMIGFNRVNESVGGIFNIILLGSLAYFEIIELPTIIFGAFAVILMLVITSTRKK